MKTLALLCFITLFAVLAGGITYVYFTCPCDRTPGWTLWGEEQTEAVTDWSFANDAPLCQLEVDNGVMPQSINLNCMSSSGDLFISCSQCDGKRWSAVALRYPTARILIAGSIYPVNLQRVTAPDQLDRSWHARAEKLARFGNDVAGDRPDHWWSFKLASR